MPIILDRGENARVNSDLSVGQVAGDQVAELGSWPASASLGTIGRNLSTALECGSAPAPLLSRFALQSAARSLLPREAVSYCMRRIIPEFAPSVPVDMRGERPTRLGVDVYQVPSTQSAVFGGLMTCKSVWHCPVCAAKISERRREELTQGIKNWYDQGGKGRVLLVTYTMQHKSSDGIAAVLRRIIKARTRLLSGRSWQSFRDEHRFVGQVRSLEVTYGSNGWHIHMHVLFFFDCDVKIIPFEHEMKTRWMVAAKFAGGYASYANGCDVRYSDQEIAKYIAKFGKEPEWKDNNKVLASNKWSVSHEIAKAAVKSGRDGNRSPIELLRDYLLGDEDAGKLWLQYAVVFKGQRQLFFSQGLKCLLDIADKSDGDLVDEMENDAILFAQLSKDQWRYVLALDIRADLLALAGRGDSVEFWLYLWKLGVPNCPVGVFPAGTLVIDEG